MIHFEILNSLKFYLSTIIKANYFTGMNAAAKIFQF